MDYKSNFIKAVKDSGLATKYGWSDNDLHYSVNTTNENALTFDLGRKVSEEDANLFLEFASLQFIVEHGQELDVEHDGVNAFKVTVGTYEPIETFDVEELSSIEEASDDEEDFYDDDDEEDNSDSDEDDLPHAGRTKPNGDLVVLTTPDLHRMAAKMFQSLDNPEDMSNYVTFLKDLDNLLNKHGGVPRAEAREKADKNDKNAPIIEESDYSDLASSFEELSAYFEETARKKKGGAKGGFKEGRSGLLSAFMRSMSGDNGERILSYWDKLLSSEFKEAMNSIVSKMAGVMEAEKQNRHGGEESAALTREGDAAKEVPEDKSEPYDKPTEKDAVISPAPAAENAQPPAEPEKTPLYAFLPVVNGEDIKQWAKEAGFKKMLPVDDLHVTIAYSKTPIDPAAVEVRKENLKLEPSAERKMDIFGEGALVLKLSSADLNLLTPLWQKYRDVGASWDYEDYQAHVTIAYDPEISKEKLLDMTPYDGEILLGAEQQREINSNSQKDAIANQTEIAKVMAKQIDL